MDYQPDLDFDDELVTHQQRCFFVPQSLADPLTDTALIKLDFALNGPSVANANRLSSYVNVKQEQRFISQVRQEFPAVRLQVDHGSTQLARLRKRLLSMKEDPIGWSNLDKNLSEMSPVTSRYHHAIEGWLTKQGLPRKPIAERIHPPSGVEMNYRRAARKLATTLAVRRRLSEGGNQAMVKMSAASIGLEIGLGEQFGVLVENGKNGSKVGRLITMAMFLNIHDFFKVRSTTLIANRFLHCTLEEQIVRAWGWCDYFIDLGNDGYLLAKSIESLAKCKLSELSGGDVRSPSAGERMEAKVIDRLSNWAGRDPRIKAGFTEHAAMVRSLRSDILTMNGIRGCAEIFGLAKTIGYPIVSISAGGKKTMEAATSKGNICLSAVMTSCHLICHLTLKNYIARTGSWPKLIFDTQGLELERLYKEEAPALHDGLYPIDEWAFAHFTPIYEFDPSVDYLPFVHDKACSPGFDEGLKRYLGQPIDHGKRRAILSMLGEKGGIDTIDLISRFARREYVAEKPLVEMQAKECEFKLEPRMFCKLPMHHKLPLNIIQENVKSGLFTDLPYQSMTLSRTELQHNLWDLSGRISRQESPDTTVFIEIDFSSWNTHFRAIWTEPFGRRLDEMYGTQNVFGRVHDYFNSCRIVVTEPGERIPMYESFGKDESNHDTSWTGHRGGIDGIDQATWTAQTITMIYMALEGLNAEFRLLGQGDNQVLAVTFFGIKREESDALNMAVARLMGKLDIWATLFDHEAKPDEFIESCTVLTYSKQLMVNGVEVPTTLKFASKIGPSATAEVPSFSESLGAIFSAGVACADKTHDPLALYLFTIEMSSMFFDSMGVCPFTGSDITKIMIANLTTDERAILLSTPSTMGGFPISPMFSFWIAGEPDLLTSSIASLRALGETDPCFRKIFSYLSKDSSWRTEPDLTALVSDPESIPLKKETGLRGRLEAAARESLEDLARNPDVNEMTRLSSIEESMTMKGAISQMRPLYPHLAHDLYKSSLAGRVDTLCSRFTFMRSLVKDAYSRGAASGGLLGKEDSLTRSTVSMGMRIAESAAMSISRGVTSFSIAEGYRSRWGLAPDDIQGVSSSHPADYDISFNPFDTGIKIVAVDGCYNMEEERGPARPFFGSRTEMRTTEESKWSIDHTSGLGSLKKVLLAYTAGDNEAAKPLFDAVLSTSSSWTVDQLACYLPKTVGGSIAHRWSGASTGGSIGPHGSINILSFYVNETCNVPGFSASKDDRPIAVQQYVSFLLNVARLSSLRGVPLQYVVSRLDPFSLPILTSRPMVVKGALPQLKRAVIQSPLGRVSDITLKPILGFKGDPLPSVTLQPHSSLREVRRAVGSIMFNALIGQHGASMDLIVATSGGESRTAMLTFAEWDNIGPDVIWAGSIDALCSYTADLTLKDRSIIRKGELYPAALISARALLKFLAPILSSSNLALGNFKPYYTMTGEWSTETTATRMADIVTEKLLTDKSMDCYWLVRPFNRAGVCQVRDFSIKALSALCLVSARWVVDIMRLPTTEDTMSAAIKLYANARGFLRNRSEFVRSTKYLLEEARAALLLDLVAVHGPDVVKSLEREMERKARLTAWSQSPIELVRALRSWRSDKESSFTIAKMVRQGSVSFASSNPRFETIVRQCPNSFAGNGTEPFKGVLSTLDSRNSRVYGAVTSIIEVWDPIIQSLGDLSNLKIIVVGTGRGGIQAAIALRGGSSEGVDLRAAVSSKAIAGDQPSPPEIRSLGLQGKGSYWPGLYRHDGDWFNPGTASAILRTLPDVLIIDIETGGERQAISLLRPLWLSVSRSQWVVLVKLLVTRSDLELLVEDVSSWIGVVKVSWALMSGCLCPDHASPVVLRLDISGTPSRPLHPIYAITHISSPGSLTPSVISDEADSRKNLGVRRGTSGVVQQGNSMTDVLDHLQMRHSNLKARLRKARNKIDRRPLEHATNMSGDLTICVRQLTQWNHLSYQDLMSCIVIETLQLEQSPVLLHTTRDRAVMEVVNRLNFWKKAAGFLISVFRPNPTFSRCSVLMGNRSVEEFLVHSKKVHSDNSPKTELGQVGANRTSVDISYPKLWKDTFGDLGWNPDLIGNPYGEIDPDVKWGDEDLDAPIDHDGDLRLSQLKPKIDPGEPTRSGAHYTSAAKPPTRPPLAAHANPLAGHNKRLGRGLAPTRVAARGRGGPRLKGFSSAPRAPGK